MEGKRDRIYTECWDLLKEVLKFLDEKTLQDLYEESSPDLSSFLRNEGYVREEREERYKTTRIPPSSSKVSENCTTDNSADVCLRRASQENSTALVDLFLSKDASDISGALIKAAEQGSKEVILLLQERATESMFSVAAAHAALGGHLEITKGLYERGADDSEKNYLNAILYMAVLGGHVPVIEWALSEGANLATIPKGIIGKNIESVLELLEPKEKYGNREKSSYYLYGATSFGTRDDLDYVFEAYPYLKEDSKATRSAFIGALSNGNIEGANYILKYVNEKEKPDEYLLAAARGNLDSFIVKYSKTASKLIPAVLLATSHGNLGMVKFLSNKRRLALKSALAYATYSGSLAIIEHFKPKSPDTDNIVMMARGAAAGGNWDLLYNYLLQLSTNLDEDEYEQDLVDIFAETILHSQMSCFNSLYDFLKDSMDEDKLADIIEISFEGKTILTYLQKSHIDKVLVQRFREVLGEQ